MTIQSTLISPSRAHYLAHANLITIFSNPDPTTRLAALPKIYTDDVVVYVSPPPLFSHLTNPPPSYEPSSATLSGPTAINDQVSTLLSQHNGWSFTPTGPVKLNHDCITLTWGFGPKKENGEIEIKMTGQDVIYIHQGKDQESARIRALYVIIDGPADVTA